MAFQCHNYHIVFGSNIVGVSRPRATGALTAGQVARAYGVPVGTLSNLPSVKLGFVSLGGALNQDDVNATYALDNLPPPVVEKLFVDGATEVPDPGSSDIENHLDVIAGVPATLATGRAQELAICFAPNTDNGIANGMRRLVDAGCEIICISWGLARPRWSPTGFAATEAAFQYAENKGVHVFAASGDNSADDGTRTPATDYPSCSLYCLAVGGVLLQLAPDGSIASQLAWGDGREGDNGGGGGFDASQPIPDYQKGIVSGSYRGCPDCSGNADPSSGYREFSGGSELSVGGTSGSAPHTGGIFAIIRGQMKYANKEIPSLLGPALYPAGSSIWHDVTRGSNGYPAKAGWDAVTGLGTPNFPLLSAYLLGKDTSPDKSLKPGDVLFGVTAYRTILPGEEVDFETEIKIPIGDYDWVLSDRPAPKRLIVGKPAGLLSLATGGRFQRILDAVRGLLVKYGPDAVPYIETLVSTLPLTAEQKTALDQLIEQVLGRKPADYTPPAGTAPQPH